MGNKVFSKTGGGTTEYLYPNKTKKEPQPFPYTTKKKKNYSKSITD